MVRVWRILLSFCHPGKRAIGICSDSGSRFSQMFLFCLFGVCLNGAAADWFTIGLMARCEWAQTTREVSYGRTIGFVSFFSCCSKTNSIIVDVHIRWNNWLVNEFPFISYVAVVVAVAVDKFETNALIIKMISSFSSEPSCFNEFSTSVLCNSLAVGNESISNLHRSSWKQFFFYFSLVCNWLCWTTPESTSALGMNDT